MPPERRVRTCLLSDTSGTASSMGFAISRMGLSSAAVSATEVRDRKAPETMPQAALKA